MLIHGWFTPFLSRVPASLASLRSLCLSSPPVSARVGTPAHRDSRSHPYKAPAVDTGCSAAPLALPAYPQPSGILGRGTAYILIQSLNIPRYRLVKGHVLLGVRTARAGRTVHDSVILATHFEGSRTVSMPSLIFTSSSGQVVTVSGLSKVLQSHMREAVSTSLSTFL